MARHNREPTSVLLVDDARDERDMYAEFLRTRGYRTLQAASGLDALKLAARVRPAIVVTDVVLPGLDGFALTRALKQNERTHDVPVVILTGRVFDPDRDAAARAGCDLLLAKPCLPDELHAAIRRVLAAKRLQRVRGRAIPAEPEPQTDLERKVGRR